jgi:DNA-binding NtrC family response regulator
VNFSSYRSVTVLHLTQVRFPAWTKSENRLRVGPACPTKEWVVDLHVPAVSSNPPLDDQTNTADMGERSDAVDLCLLVSCAAGVSIVPVGARTKFTLGRSPRSDVVLADDSVSRRHAVLRVSPCTIEDLGSRNGTTVQGLQVQPGRPAFVREGARIEVGNATIVLMRVRPPMRDARSVRQGSGTATANGVVVRDPTVHNLLAMLDVIAPSDLPVLLQGETGVGKDLFAREIHRRSARSGGPFLKIDCAALAESLLESELFGYERGAFTGAERPKLGLFEAASGGTVFLDEIAELPVAMQAKLLRVVEDREVMRVGGVSAKAVDVRIVAATHRDLPALSASGQFRADLFFRLNGVTLALPPLRARKQDIAPLAEHFLGLACARRSCKPLRLTPDAIEALEAYSWPGNVRELRMTLERAALLCADTEIDASRLWMTAFEPAASTPGGSGETTARPADWQKRGILQVLETAEGNQSRAARLLGVSRSTLLRRLNAFGIEGPRKKQRQG